MYFLEQCDECSKKTNKGGISVGVDIHVAADEVWSFFQANKDRLSKEMVAIAENEDTEYAIYLTEDFGYPTFFVCKGENDPEYEEGAINERDCMITARKCYSQYLFPVIINSKKSCPEQFDEDWNYNLTLYDMEDMIYEREDELRLALCDFLQVVLQECGDCTDIELSYGPGTIDEILNYFLEYLGFEQRFPVYRPMFITDEETGCEIYTEFPYDIEASYEDDGTII